MKEEKTKEDFSVLVQLIIQVWKKRLAEMPDPSSERFSHQVELIRTEIHDQFRIFRENVQEGKGFKDNIKSIIQGNININKLPTWRTIEALCAYLYEYAPEDPTEWSRTYNANKPYWNRFKRELHNRFSEINNTNDQQAEIIFQQEVQKLEITISSLNSRVRTHKRFNILSVFFFALAMIITVLLVSNKTLQVSIQNPGCIKTFEKFHHYIEEKKWDSALNLVTEDWKNERGIQLAEDLQSVYRMTMGYPFMRFIPYGGEPEQGVEKFYAWFSFNNAKSQAQSKLKKFLKEPIISINDSMYADFRNTVINEIRSAYIFPEELHDRALSKIDSTSFNMLYSETAIVDRIADDLGLTLSPNNTTKGEGSTTLAKESAVNDPKVNDCKGSECESYEFIFLVTMKKIGNTWKIDNFQRKMVMFR